VQEGPEDPSVGGSHPPDHVWALDFVFDETIEGRPIKVLNITDKYTRQTLTCVAARNIDADRTSDKPTWRLSPSAKVSRSTSRIFLMATRGLGTASPRTVLSGEPAEQGLRQASTSEPLMSVYENVGIAVRIRSERAYEIARNPHSGATSRFSTRSSNAPTVPSRPGGGAFVAAGR
jgi:hypothetical protein